MNVLMGSAVVEVHLGGHCNYILGVELSDQLHSYFFSLRSNDTDIHGKCFKIIINIVCTVASVPFHTLHGPNIKTTILLLF